MILPRSPTHTFFTPLFTNPANRHSHDFGVNSPLNHDFPGDVAHCQATLTGSTSLWDVRGEPAICSIMDFGPRAGDWTLKLNSVSYNWNFVTCMFPNRSTWHSQTMIKILKNTFTRYLPSRHQLQLQKNNKIHPSAFATVGLVL